MKRLIFILLLFGMILNSSAQKKWYTYPAASSVAGTDLFLLHQSGTSKNIPYSVIGGAINDTADVLRAEFPPLWRTNIADTATVLRSEIAAAVTADTAWTYSGNYV